LRAWSGLRRATSPYLKPSILAPFCSGVAYLFWHDFVRNGRGNFDVLSLLPVHHLRELEPMRITRTSFWTWITGDQVSHGRVLIFPHGSPGVALAS